jgi:hypothetical protein
LGEQCGGLDEGERKRTTDQHGMAAPRRCAPTSSEQAVSKARKIGGRENRAHRFRPV